MAVRDRHRVYTLQKRLTEAGASHEKEGSPLVAGLTHVLIDPPSELGQRLGNREDDAKLNGREH